MRTILIVEPHAATLELLAEGLQLAGYRVIRAGDAPSAFELFLHERPDAVVLSTGAGRIGELSLGRRLREGAGGERVRIVAVDQGHLGKPLGVASVLDARADAFLPDPTKPGLKEKLRELLAGAAPRRPKLETVLSRPPERSGHLDPAATVKRLAGLAREGASGILVAQSSQVVRRIFLVGGQVRDADSTSRRDTLVRRLHAQGRIAPGAAGAALAAMAAEGIGAAEALVSTSAIAAADLPAVLRAHVCEGAARLLAMRDGQLTFFPGAGFEGEIGGEALPVPACVRHAATEFFPSRVLARALAPLLSRHPRRLPALADELARLPLSREELAVASQLDGSTPLRDLLAAGRGELHLRHVLLFTLVSCGLVEMLEIPATSGPGDRLTARIPARRRKPLPAGEEARIREAALHAMTGSYFQVLGLSIAATSDDVERAYHEVASRFHPDLLAEYELGPLEDLLRTLQERIDAAYRVLSSDAKRKAYLEHVLRRLEPPARSGAVVADAEVEVQRGIAILEDDPRGAALAFERAIALSPREPAYYAYLAWARFRGATVGSPTDRARDALRVLRKGLAARPGDDRLIAILGILEAESGNAPEARRHLAQALRLNDRNRLARAALRRLNRLPG